MDELDFRVTKLEVMLPYEVAIMRERLSALEYRLDHHTPTAPSASSSPIPHLPDGVAAGMVKMVAAIALPIIILLATGDPQKAKMVQGLLGGG